MIAALLAAALLAAPDLRLVGALDVPKDIVVDTAPFGGISGVDYDRQTDRWLMISDDRSDKAPARFFVGTLDYDARGVRGLRVETQIPLRREDGSAFPSTAGEGERADAEALRIDPKTGDLVWSSEGDAPRGFDPAVRRMSRDGASKGAIATTFRFDPAKANGARINQTFEGLSFSPDGRWLWLALEAPLIQDGPAPTVSNGGLTRITRLDRDGKVSAQYAYRLDPVQAAPVKRSDNGVSEILAVDDRRLLVLERSGVEDGEGRFSFHCRLYLAEIARAEDVAGRQSLAAGDARPMTKRLLINFDRLPGTPPTNLEAMAWGPKLSTGERSLVLFADDNFDPHQSGQVLVFAVRP